jgi:hypothetical protein
MTPGKAGGLLGEPLKGGVNFCGRSKRQAQLHLFVALLFGFLVADVLDDRRFVQSYRGYKVAPGPEVLAREIPLLSHKKPSDHDRALPFQVPNHVRYRVFRRYPQAHVNMIRSQMPLDNFHVLMAGQFVKHLAKHPSDLTIDHFLPPLGNENNVIFAIPFCVTQTSILCHGGFTSVVEGTVENPTDRRNGQTPGSPPAKPGVYLI